MVESRSMVKAGQQRTAHPVQLADVAPAEAAQEDAQGGGRLDHAAESAGRPAGAQRIDDADAVATSQRRGYQRRNLIAGIGSAWRIAQVLPFCCQSGQGIIDAHQVLITQISGCDALVLRYGANCITSVVAELRQEPRR